MARKYPNGIASFQRIRRGGHCYVDKTALIYQLVNGSGDNFFLARPRRFGKTLLCSTLEALFSGNRELFGEIGGQPALAIDSMDWTWEKHPVIMLSLNAECFHDGESALLRLLTDELLVQSGNLEIELIGDGIVSQFKHLIRRAYAKYGKQVVIIIDEYDKPLLETIDRPDLHEKYKRILKGFYGVLKHCHEYIRFIFVTGVTKFSKVSIFSELNNLTELSFDPRYASLCGITQEELEDNFASSITAISSKLGRERQEYLDALRDFYNGYRFSMADTRVYNPYGLLLHFESGGLFRSYWYETGSPSFLVRMVSSRKTKTAVLDGIRVHDSEFSKYNVDNMDPEAVLYQAGYLTITRYDEQTEEYFLEFPNREIRLEYIDLLLGDFVSDVAENNEALIRRLPTSLRKGDIDGAIDAIYWFLESISWEISSEKEKYFQTAIYVMLRTLGVDCEAEVSTVCGRVDAVIETAEYVYVIEFKLGESSDAAMGQINDKGYANKWLGGSRRVYKVGVAFDRVVRNIVEWQCEVVEAGEFE